MAYAGIDYGLGRTNVDVATGIRYGVISSHTIGQFWYEEAEADYGDPTCPECGNTARSADTEPSTEEYEQYKRGCTDYACDTCKHTFDSQWAFPDEAIGYSYTQDGYNLTSCLDSDVMVLKSEYFTYAQYCSPCVPGAGNLDTELIPEAGQDPDRPIVDVKAYHSAAEEAGYPRAYCLDHSWFEEGKAPYRVFRVSDGTEVLPEEA